MDNKVKYVVKYVVTHPGKAHRDDFLSCCLAMAHEGRALCVQRREPLPGELADPNVLVLDVGGIHDPTLRNFDHHQLMAEERECALSLWARAVGLEEALKTTSWYEWTRDMDSAGPNRTAQRHKLPRFPFETLSPVEGALLGMFETHTCVSDRDGLARMMHRVGKGILDRAQEVKESLYETRSKMRVEKVGGVPLMVFEGVLGPGANQILEEMELAGSVSHDDRGHGWTLYRFNDHPALNFAVLEGDPRVTFAHRGGFIAKTTPMEVADALRLVQEALT
jgi:hypothetical protein